VKTIDNSGAWNDNAVYLDINITPPWWGAWYFKLAIGLLVLINIIMFYILRIHRIRISNQILEKQVEIKTADLVKTNNELKQFAYVVSHDLKAPLRGISSLAHWIGEDISNGYYSELSTNLGLIKNRVSRMQNLINGILYYSRIGKLNISKEKFNTYEAIKKVVDTLNINPGFNIHFTGKFPNIRYSRTLFEQIFTDLIDNSVKYHHKKEGNITISCIENRNFYIFSEKDDGPGILKEYHKKIFIMFQTLNPKDKFESTGIGLSVAKKIVEENKGTIWVESDGRTGSKFIFTVPK
jgi:light-regulated signal transduction histidine kinase (bacteriophytochrome)